MKPLASVRKTPAKKSEKTMSVGTSHHANSKSIELMQIKFRTRGAYCKPPERSARTKTRSRHGSTSTLSTTGHTELTPSTLPHAPTANNNTNNVRRMRNETEWLPPPFFVPEFHDADAVRRTQYRQCGNTYMLLPSVSLGVGPCAGGWRGPTKAAATEVRTMVRAALRSGITYVRTIGCVFANAAFQLKTHAFV